MTRREWITAATAGGAAALTAVTASEPALAAPDAASFGPRWVKAADGTQLYVRSWGSGPPIVFLAGWALPSEAWSYQMAALADTGFRCIAFDRRGHGRSEDPGQGYDYDTLADDLARVLAAYGVLGATVVAHSMSGGEIVRAMRRPDVRQRVRRILFLATTLPCLGARPDNPIGVPPAMFDQLRQRFHADFPKWIEDNADPFVVPATSPLMRTWIKTIMLQTSLRAAIELNKTMTAADLRPELAALNLPMLFIHGDRDASAPLPISAGPASKIARGSTLTVYEGAPHGLFVTHIERLNADIRAFATAR